MEIEKAIHEFYAAIDSDSMTEEPSNEAMALAITALREQQEREFTNVVFHELFNACKTVYEEKPEVHNFNEYVIGLVEKDLGHSLQEAQEDGRD